MVGSSRPGRLALYIAQWTAKAAEGHGGFDVELVDLTETGLPLLDEPAYPRTVHAEFFSFCTNDLTQTGWGVSRDDVEASFFMTHLGKGIFGVSPFETIDKDGVGSHSEAPHPTRVDSRRAMYAVQVFVGARPSLRCGQNSS